MRNDLYLIDTSVWIGYFSPRSRTPRLQTLSDRVDVLISSDEASVTGMIRLEVLGGARDQRDYEQLEEAFSSMLSFPIGEDTWDHAASMAFDLRRQGITVPFPDLLIAAVAIQAGAVVLHQDRHFDSIAARISLRVESHLL